MKKSGFMASAALMSTLAFAAPVLAQDADITNADPACVITNADGSKALDTVKCKDGKPMAANESTTPAPDANSNTAAQPAPADQTTTSSVGAPLIVAPESIAGAKVMTATDFIGKRVYSKTGDDIGEVNDLFVTDSGSVQAVVLGVGGFLGIGEKDVAVSMKAVEMVPDGEAVRLVVDATKEQLQSAPAFDRVKRSYVTN